MRKSQICLIFNSDKKSYENGKPLCEMQLGLNGETYKTWLARRREQRTARLASAHNGEERSSIATIVVPAPPASGERLIAGAISQGAKDRSFGT